MLDNYFEGYYVVENVVPYYEPLIEAQKLGRHLFWSNLELPKVKFTARGSFDDTKELSNKLGYDTSNWKGVNKKLLLRNCVEPEVGLYIFNQYLKTIAKPIEEDDSQMTIYDVEE